MSIKRFFITLITLVIACAWSLLPAQTDKNNTKYYSNLSSQSGNISSNRNTTNERKTTTNNNNQKSVTGVKQAKVPKARTKKTSKRYTPSKKKSGSTSQPFPGRTEVQPNRAILYMTPINLQLEIDEEFTSEVKFYNPVKFVIDTINIYISYDPEILQLDNADDIVLKDKMPLVSDLMIDHKKGLISYKATLPTPTMLKDTTILEIDWTALRKSSSAEISFSFDDENSTSLISKGLEVLGDPSIYDDGTISCALEIIDPDAPEMPDLAIVGPGSITDELVNPEKLSIKLSTEKEIYDLGEEFVADVVLSTKEPIFFQTLQLGILFNPEKLEVIDWDEDNWIRRGINIFDADYHKKFPFDYHIKNMADNDKGTIFYKMGMTSEVEINSATIASIKFKAKERVRATSIIFNMSDEEKPLTELTYMGKSYLEKDGKNLNGIKLSIK